MFLTKYIKTVDGINKIIIKLIAILLFVIFVLLVTQVFFRFVINKSLSWSEEAARYLIIWTVFLGVAIGVRRQSLIAVEALVQNVPEKLQLVFKAIALIITIAFSVFLVVFGIEMCQMTINHQSTALHMPMSYAYAAIPMGGTLILINALSVLVELFLGRRETGKC
ncbi:TRAP transporter small permease [Desulfitibacter alkalitolerans]|uniref:TRAP transporter small permease n=1 Tax=Desulfitibacter alkalitolerans TaxID=264641 RepID=UPI000688E76F|nr:TRAP transporter small permease [Desulfitibacter alkalitolerans]